MSVYSLCQDALQLDESLAAGDVSRAWLLWSGAVETALVDAYQFSRGPLPSRVLFLAGGVLRFGLSGLVVTRFGRFVVMLLMPMMLLMFSCIVTVMNVLGAMIQYGVSLSRSEELTAQWDRILAAGPLYPVTLDDQFGFHWGLMDVKPYMLASAGQPSLHGYNACMVYWTKEHFEEIAGKGMPGFSV